VNFKLLKAVGKFDPTKGTAFTFVSQVIANALCTSVSNARRDTARYKKLTRPILAQLTDKTEDRAGVDDITHRMRASVRTTLTDAVEFRKK
jgi:DNA-directed RNA polymerase specialized sigma subunit